MIGAVTTLIVVVAVYLSYNANSGLPFVPVYRVSLDVPNAARLVENNEVRIGGNRVGVVESLTPVEPDTADLSAARGGGGGVTYPESGPSVARLGLKLDKNVGPLPKDSAFRVRYRSSFGLKYLEIVRGTGPAAEEGFAFSGLDDGGSCALPTDPERDWRELPAAARNGCFEEQTEFDDINNTFDDRTRANARANLLGYGDGFVGRGTSLNEAIGALEPLFQDLKPVARVLAARDTNLRRFFAELADSARIVAPVAREQAEMFGLGATTFAAISESPEALRETISESVPTLETGISLLPAQRDFLRRFTVLSRELRPGVRDLRITLPTLVDAVEIGTPVLEHSPEINRKLARALRSLERLVERPVTSTVLKRLRMTFDTAEPLAEYVVPAQTVCNYWNYWFTFLPNGLTDRDQVGHTFRQILTRFPAGTGQAEAPMGGYTGIPGNGRTGLSGGGEFRPYEIPIQQTHPYQPTGQRNDDCQAGQVGYALGRLAVDNQKDSDPSNRVSDLPGSRGPTTVFFNSNKQRELVDTRLSSRQPRTWKRVGR
jgi:ABC-type transporter Mla subunit MlaD